MTDLEARKYSFIENLVNVGERTLEKLESVLKQEKSDNQEVSEIHQEILQERIESYHNNPDDLLDWEDVKDNW